MADKDEIKFGKRFEGPVTADENIANTVNRFIKIISLETIQAKGFI